MDTARYDRELHEAAQRFRDAPQERSTLAHAHSRLFHAFAFAGYAGVNEASALRAYIFALDVRFENGIEVRDTRGCIDVNMLREWRLGRADSELPRFLNGEAQKRGWERTFWHLAPHLR